MKQAIKKIGLRNVQNSLCLMFLKYGKPQLAKEALFTIDPGAIEKMVIYLTKQKAAIRKAEEGK